jgi:cobalt-zinc-cadmium efflux system membrane fusion protein
VVLEYGRPVVFVESAPGRFERREVATGVRAESLVAITRGVQAGERVVVDGAVLLKGR